jgi:ATP-dependent Clp protease ATP-binding subunit ClpA
MIVQQWSATMRGMSESGYPLHKCTDRARRVLRKAFALSIHRDHGDVQPADLFDALARNDGVSAAALGELGYALARLPEKLPAANDSLIRASQTARQVIIQAEGEASELGHIYAGTEHLLLALAALHPEVFSDADAVRAEVLSLLGHGPECA